MEASIEVKRRGRAMLTWKDAMKNMGENVEKVKRLMNSRYIHSLSGQEER